MTPEGKFYFRIWVVIGVVSTVLALGLGLGLTGIYSAQEHERQSTMMKLIDQGVAPVIAACVAYDKDCTVEVERMTKRTTLDKVTP